MYVDSSDLRSAFAARMSDMYKAEVPLYQDLIQIVQKVNLEVMKACPGMTGYDSDERLVLERHGAIRLGTPDELRIVQRIFEVLGMYAVDYYDLSMAGLPMHATCFRPTQASALDKNPFRVFTTLLRPELISSDRARQLAARLLSRRRIVTDALLEWLVVAERQGGRLQEKQAAKFITEALKTFSWNDAATATYEEYLILKDEHPILADIACFGSAHLNHLTPRTLDIDSAESAMRGAGMAVKDIIEGPPRRKNPILLRQTSFMALKEPVRFGSREVHDGHSSVESFHTARFGEIEERGVALTPAGRAAYDELQLQISEATQSVSSLARKGAIRAEIFGNFPDDWSELQSKGLVYCHYRSTDKGRKVAGSLRSSSSGHDVRRLVEEGILETLPMTYEDFLPFSAAGIFRSNIRNGLNTSSVSGACHDQPGFERSLGRKVISSHDLYRSAEEHSLELCYRELKIDILM